MPTFNLIGAGQVGQALGYLLANNAGLVLQHVLSRSINSAEQACVFIGQGQAVHDYSDLMPANVYLVTVPDQEIIGCAEKLAATGLLRPEDIIIHCSGVRASSDLIAAKSYEAKIASLHPIKSFVDPQRAIATFSGTYCGIEGDPETYPIIQAWVAAIGGKSFIIDPNQKLIYHSALVFACNYLNALTDISLRCLEQASLDRSTALEILHPLMHNTLEQIFALGPQGTAAALSGPIARGENEIIQQELLALKQWDQQIADTYQLLGQFTVELAQKKGTDPAKLALLRKTLKAPS